MIEFTLALLCLVIYSFIWVVTSVDKMNDVDALLKRIIDEGKLGPELNIEARKLLNYHPTKSLNRKVNR